jgi:hypothetical protein
MVVGVYVYGGREETQKGRTKMIRRRRKVSKGYDTAWASKVLAAAAEYVRAAYSSDVADTLSRGLKKAGQHTGETRG